MPPFEYRTPVNPFAGSVGDLLEHSGDASAFAAHAIGQTVAALPELMQQQRRTALVDEAGRRQLDEAKRKDLEESRARSIQGAMDVVLKGSLVKDPATGLTTYDREKLQAGMTEVGVPQTALAQYLPVLDASDKAIAQAKALHVEALKHSAQLVDMAGNDPAVFKAEIQRGIANGLFTAQDAQPYLVAAEQDPTHIGRITAAMLGRDPHAGEFTLNPGDRRFDANGRELATNPKPADTPSMQSKDVLLDGKPALVSFNPKTGTYHDATGADVTPRVRPMPPASVQYPKDESAVALSPEGLDAAAMMFAKSGQLPPMGMGKSAADARTRIINRAAQLMPGLDVASAKADFDANKSSLVKLQAQRDAIGAFEQTAVKNIDMFLKQAEQVPDTGIALLNVPVRFVTGKVLGTADQAAYNAARQVAVNEIAKITTNPSLSGQLSDSARHEVEDFNPRTATLSATVKVMKLLKQDMANRATSMDEQLTAIKNRIIKATAPEPAAAHKAGESFTVGDFKVVVH
jgi:hypothetical protein